MRKLRLVQDYEYPYYYFVQRRVWGLWFEVESITAHSQADAQIFLDKLANKPDEVILYPTL